MTSTKDDQATWPAGSGAWTLDETPPEDRYVPRSLIGQGGMGRVHLAWDPRLRREVALKQPLDGASHEVQQRLVREARVAASLQHPGIVRVYDSGESAQGTPWYTMELIRGKSLREHIDEAEDTKARLNLLPALLAVCEAVAYAHNSGIIHRDLKPDNLMIGAFGQVQVVDWGLARPVDEGWTQILSNVNHTTDGAAMGTPAYMSPEQIEGDNVGPASDVWSIGLLLYELISGQRAYSAPTAREVLVQVLAGPPKPLKLVTPNADPGLVALVERCLQSDPNDRWQHGGELASALGQWLSRRHVAAHTTPKTSWLSLAVVLIVGLVMTGALYRTYDLGVALTQAQHRLFQEREAASNSLSASWLSQAVRAAEDIDQGRAEVLAAHSLTHHRTATALGVFARFGLRERAELIVERQLPDCRYLALATTGGRAFCVSDHFVDVIDDSGESSWRIPVEANRVTPDVRGQHLRIDADRGSTVIDVDERQITTVSRSSPLPRSANTLEPRAWLSLHFSNNQKLQTFRSSTTIGLACADRGGVETAVGVDANHHLVVCGDGALLSATNGTETLIMQAVPPDEMAWVMSVDLAVQNVIIGTLNGQVYWLHVHSSEVILHTAVGTDQMRTLAISPDGSRAAASAPGRGTWVWDRAHVLAPLRLPHDATALSFSGREQLVTSQGDTLRRYKLPDKLSSHVLHPPDAGGVVGLHWGADGLGVATGKHMSAFDDDAWSETIPLLTGKDIVMRSNGETLAASLHLDAASSSSRRVVRARRVVELASGHIVVAAIGNAEAVLQPDLTPVPGTRLLGAIAQDLEVSPALHVAALLSRDGSIYTVADGAPPTIDRWGTWNASAIAVGPRGEWLAVGDTQGVTILDGGSAEPVRTLDDGDDTIDLAVSPDGRRIAGTDRSRFVRVWDVQSGELLLKVRSQTQRVGTLTFSPDGSRLATGSWDKSVHILDLRVLDADATFDPEQLQTAWGLRRTDVLGASTPQPR